MTLPLVVILMGSISDKGHSQKIADAVQQFDLEVEMRVGSAHKTASHVIQILNAYESSLRKVVYITVAGRSNALSGFVDGYVDAPVIACPPSSNTFAGMDIFSSLRMPSGIAPAVILEPENAALLAAKIFAMFDENVAKKLATYKTEHASKVIDGDHELKAA